MSTELVNSAGAMFILKNEFAIKSFSEGMPTNHDEFVFCWSISMENLKFLLQIGMLNEILKTGFWL